MRQVAPRWPYTGRVPFGDRWDEDVRPGDIVPLNKMLDRQVGRLAGPEYGLDCRGTVFRHWNLEFILNLQRPHAPMVRAGACSPRLAGWPGRLGRERGFT